MELKICPVCQQEFKPTRKTQITCSKSCANTHFRTGKDNNRWKGGISQDYYKKVCFSFHDRKCIVCSEANIIEAHHLDRNKKNNSPENLIPLCPTHHRYCHSQFREIIEKKIDKYLKRYHKDNL
jgi:hypothetical protein